MRFTVYALSAVLLSGCAWPNGFNFGQKSQYYKAKPAHQQARHHKNCVIQVRTQPIPHGCYPSEVVVSGPQNPYGAFPQKPDFGTYATSGFGSHVDKVHTQGANHKEKPKFKKPKLRTSLSLGMEKSIGGIALDYDVLPNIDPALSYDPTAFDEGFVTGSAAAGNITSTRYTAILEKVDKPSISFDDIHSTPVTLSGGLEYIANPHMTFFANAGYTRAEGEEGEAVIVQAETQKIVTSQDFDTTTLAPAGPAVSNTTYRPNQEIARFAYSFDDLKRIDLEIGGRYYFDPVVNDHGYKTLTPFVSAAVGARHYNDLGFTTQQRQGFYQRIMGDAAGELFYDVVNTTPKTQLYEAQWVPTGALTAGMEWQVTPGAALALETGLRFEGSREYANGTDGDENLTVPLTLRGSFNF